MKRKDERSAWWTTCLVLSLTSVLACSSAGEQSVSLPKDLAAEPIGAAECAACGMVVREQPAPRAQVVHADATRAHLCSLSDLAHYSLERSKHGKVHAAFVEVLDPAHDPASRDTSDKPWLPVEQATYVIGIERSGVMGQPVLAFADAASAQAAATRHHGRVLAWAELQRTLVGAQPTHE